MFEDDDTVPVYVIPGFAVCPSTIYRGNLC
jgi:hypothetical protein